MSLPCLINAEFLQVQDSFGQGAEAGFVVYFKKKKKRGKPLKQPIWSQIN